MKVVHDKNFELNGFTGNHAYNNHQRLIRKDKSSLAIEEIFHFFSWKSFGLCSSCYQNSGIKDKPNLAEILTNVNIPAKLHNLLVYQNVEGLINPST